MQQTTQSFRLEEEKSFGDTIQLTSWNPAMDLIAISTTKKQLGIYRPNFQRLHSITQQNFTHLCWRPDGRILATSTEDNVVRLYSVENGECVYEYKMDEQVRSLCWVRLDVEEQKDELNEMMLPIYELPEPTSIASGLPNHVEIQNPLIVEEGELNILCVATSKLIQLR